MLGLSLCYPGEASASNAVSNELVKKASKAQMPFIANKGQIANESVLFYARTFGGTVYVTKDGELVYSLPKFEEKANDKAEDRPLKHNTRDKSSQPRITNGWSLKEQLVGALGISPQGIDAARTKVNYFRGNDKSKWQNNIATYNMVSLGEVYPGIDLNLIARGENVEKVFTVKPGADVNQIKLKIEGVVSLKVTDKGELEIGTDLGAVRFTKPVAYQEMDGKREYVQVAYSLDKDTYSFTVGNYNKTRPLIIDPLLASTFTGGSGTWLKSLAIDGAGNVYIVGDTYYSDYPTTPGAYDTVPSSSEGFVSKFDASLSTLLVSTYIGGSRWENANALAVDSTGDVYVTGETDSTDYPTTNGAYDTTYNGGGRDTFVSRFDNNLSTLLASTYIGGSDLDSPEAIALDNTGNVYITGDTRSYSYPTTTGAYSRSFNGGGSDTFVSKLDTNLSYLLASTYLGGTDLEYTFSVVVDNANNVYISGYTSSANYPTTEGAFQPTYNNRNSNYFISVYDGFVTKLDQNLSTLLASTYIGGGGYDVARVLAMDSSGSIYVAGTTASSNFPTTMGAYITIQPSNNGYDEDAFVSKFNSELSHLLASTYIGGSNSGDWTMSIAVDSTDNVFVAGGTESTDYPTTAGAYDISYDGDCDCFISKLDTDLSQLVVRFLNSFTLPGG